MTRLEITELNPLSRRVGDSISFEVNGEPFTFTFANKDFQDFGDGEIHNQFSNVSGPKVNDYVAVLFQLQLRVHHNLLGFKVNDTRYIIESVNGDQFTNLSTNTSRISLRLANAISGTGGAFVNPNDVLVFNSQRGTVFNGSFSLKINGVLFGFKFVDDARFEPGSFEIPVSWLDNETRGVSTAIGFHIMASGALEFYGDTWYKNRVLSSGDRRISLKTEKPFEVTDLSVFGAPALGVSVIKPNGDVINATEVSEPISFLGVSGTVPSDGDSQTQELQNVKYRLLGGDSLPSIGFNVVKPIEIVGDFVASSTEITAASKTRTASED